MIAFPELHNFAMVLTFPFFEDEEDFLAMRNRTGADVRSLAHLGATPAG
jgi:hypothetical protein